MSGAQIFGTPFVKGYGQALWQGPRGLAFEIGADWEGQDNSALGPSYVIWDASARIPLHPKVAFQISVQNLFNLDRGTLLGRNLGSQGQHRADRISADRNDDAAAERCVDLVAALPPRTVRLTLNFQTGQ